MSDYLPIILSLGASAIAALLGLVVTIIGVMAKLAHSAVEKRLDGHDAKFVIMADLTHRNASDIASIGVRIQSVDSNQKDVKDELRRLTAEFSQLVSTVAELTGLLRKKSHDQES